MGEQHGTGQEGAEVEQVLPATGHGEIGFVLVLKDGFTGVVPTDGVVQGERGVSDYIGPTTVEDWDTSGAWRNRTAVVATAEDAARFFQPGETVAFLPRRDPRVGHRAVRVIELDARGWTTSLDFYDALLPAIGAPAWHGRSINALVDSMIWGGINAVGPPYEVRVGGVQDLDAEIRGEVERARQALQEQGGDFRRQHGRDPGVFLTIIS